MTKSVIPSYTIYTFIIVLFCFSCIKNPNGSNSSETLGKPRPPSLVIPDRNINESQSFEVKSGLKFTINQKIYRLGTSLGSGSFGRVFILEEKWGDFFKPVEPPKIIKLFRDLDCNSNYDPVVEEHELDLFLQKHENLNPYAAHTEPAKANFGAITRNVLIKDFIKEPFNADDQNMHLQAKRFILSVYKEFNRGILITDIKPENLRYDPARRQVILIDGIFKLLSKKDLDLYTYQTYPGCSVYCQKVLREGIKQ